MIAEALQPNECPGRQERQALKQQDRCEQVGLKMTVDIDGVDRDGARVLRIFRMGPPSARVAACLSCNSVCEHRIPKPLIRIN
jgi:hypothetical protein